MTATDRLVLRRPLGEVVLGWCGPWPPPARLTLVIGKLTGQAAIFDPADPKVRPEDIALLKARGARVEYYRLASASEAPAPAGPDERWFRGALYVAGNLS